MKLDLIRKNLFKLPVFWALSLLLTGFIFFFLGRLSSDKLESSFFSKPFPDQKKEFSQITRMPRLLLQNVRFYWKKDVSIYTERLGLEAISKSGDVLIFDRPDSFFLRILSGNVDFPLAGLEKLINGKLLAFPESTLRKIHLSSVLQGGSWKLKVNGEVKLVVWVAFEGIATIKLDSTTGRILVENESVHALFNPYTKELLNTVGVSIEDLVRFPAGKGLDIVGNRIYFEPFSVFPDPHVEGRIKEIKLDDDNLHISFYPEEDLVSPKTNAKNFIYVTGGKILLGGIQVHQGKILLQDTKESNPFEFSFIEYRKALFHSDVKLGEDGNIQIRMVDSPPLK